jgi:hypothetical protein
MHVEALLPDEVDVAKILGSLGYYVGETQSDGEKLMTNFVDYYRQYPWYSRIVL